MRANGFPQQFHGGKGTESVCHFCCNPATSDGNFCNRRLLDKTANQSSADGAFVFSNAAGKWYDLNGATDDDTAIRGDLDTLTYDGTPLSGGYNTASKWLSEMRYHGMYRNPETQVMQTYATPGK